jgi:hypothetical protein
MTSAADVTWQSGKPKTKTLRRMRWKFALGQRAASSREAVQRVVKVEADRNERLAKILCGVAGQHGTSQSHGQGMERIRWGFGARMIRSLGDMSNLRVTLG